MNIAFRPLYQQIYDNISEAIMSGKYQDGDKIPSEKELSEEYEVSRITSKKALEMLAENGYIKRMPGKGSFVLSKDERTVLPGEPLEGKSNRPLLLGLVISDFDETYGTCLLSGIEKEATDNKSFIITKRSCGSQEQEEEAIEDLLDIGVDGIIVMPVHGENYNPKILKLVLDGFPLVLVDRHLKGLGTPFVGTDNVSAAKKATDYLLDVGYRNISFLSPPFADTSAIEDRIEGFVKSHAEHGVAIDESLWLNELMSTLPGHNTKEKILEDIQKIKQLIANKPQISCLFAAEFKIALLAMEAIKELELKVPKDIAIVCFDGPRNFMGEYTLTHVRQREFEMGATAVKLLLKQMKVKDGKEKIFLEADLVIGASTKKTD